MSPSTDTQSSLTPDEAEDRFFWERFRLGTMIVMAGIAAVFVGELVLRPGVRPGISFVQAANFAFLGICLAVGRYPSRRAMNRFLAFAVFVSTSVSIGVVGVLANEATSPLVVMVGMAMGAAVIVPWGAGYQSAAILVNTSVAIWTLTSIQPGARDFWLQPVGSVLPTFGASIIVAYLLRRQRIAVGAAEQERQAREHGLREANQRLEAEIRDHEATEEALRFAVLELDHRVKNTLATLESIAEQTLVSSASPEEFAEGFRGRIRAMSRIHTALAARHVEAIQLSQLVELVVGPYRLHDESIALRGEDASLSSAEARVLGAALHELGTNASKYGALSTAEGRVRIESTVLNGARPRLRLDWSEQYGPHVSVPDRRGLGTKLIEAALAYESGGSVALDFAPTGVCCVIDMPLAVVDEAP